MAEAKKIIRLADIGELEKKLENALENLIPGKEDEEDEWLLRNVATELDDLKKLPTIDHENLRPVAHWEEIPGSYVSSAGKNGFWCVPATRCSNPECEEMNPCGLKTPFCPMCGFRMEDVPYDGN